MVPEHETAMTRSAAPAQAGLFLKIKDMFWKPQTTAAATQDSQATQVAASPGAVAIPLAAGSVAANAVEQPGDEIRRGLLDVVFYRP